MGGEFPLTEERRMISSSLGEADDWLTRCSQTNVKTNKRKKENKQSNKQKETTDNISSKFSEADIWLTRCRNVTSTFFTLSPLKGPLKMLFQNINHLRQM